MDRFDAVTDSETGQPSSAASPRQPPTLADFVRRHSEAIRRRWRESVRRRSHSGHWGRESLGDPIPVLLDAIAEAAESLASNPRARLANDVAERLAQGRMQEGAGLEQVVVELAVLRNSVAQVWEEQRHDRPPAAELRFLDRCMDRAIGIAVARYERERERLQEQAQRAVADRQHVLSVVSHELRNPLSTVMIACSVLEQGHRDAETLSYGVASIQRAARRMERLIRDLYDVSAIETGRLTVDPRPLEPGAVVEEVVEGFHREARGRGLRLEASVEPGLPAIHGDRDRLVQALNNVVANALKATSRGSVVVEARAGEGEVVFSVRDTGPGIAPEVQQRLFEPYWRGQSAYRGTGLGLTVVRGIVEAHGGRIWAESRAGEGAAFHFTVPQGRPA